MQTLWIARHANRQDFANPEWAATADRPHDPDLSTDGEKQADQLGRRVAALPIDRIVTSPFLRAVHTAHHAANASELNLYLEPGLGEWLNPDWFESAPDTRPISTLCRRFPRITTDHTPCRTPSFPESKHESLARLGGTARCLTERYDNETLLLVGHGITVQGVLHGLIGSDVPDSGCPLASLTKVVHNDGTWAIRHRNDTSHLENGARSANRLV